MTLIFHNPTRILFGKAALRDLKDQVPADAKVLDHLCAAAQEKDAGLGQVAGTL